MTTKELQELEELAAAIEEAEGLDPLAARKKALEQLPELRRRAHRWDHQAFAAGNEAAIDAERN